MKKLLIILSFLFFPFIFTSNNFVEAKDIYYICVDDEDSKSKDYINKIYRGDLWRINTERKEIVFVHDGYDSIINLELDNVIVKNKNFIKGSKYFFDLPSAKILMHKIMMEDTDKKMKEIGEELKKQKDDLKLEKYNNLVSKYNKWKTSKFVFMFDIKRKRFISNHTTEDEKEVLKKSGDCKCVTETLFPIDNPPY